MASPKVHTLSDEDSTPLEQEITIIPYRMMPQHLSKELKILNHLFHGEMNNWHLSNWYCSNKSREMSIYFSDDDLPTFSTTILHHTLCKFSMRDRIQPHWYMPLLSLLNTNHSTEERSFGFIPHQL